MEVPITSLMQPPRKSRKKKAKQVDWRTFATVSGIEVPKDWFLSQERPFVSCSPPEGPLELEEQMCGTLVSLKLDSSRAEDRSKTLAEAEASIESKLKEVDAKRSGDWRVDVTYYKLSTGESSTNFSEAYTVSCDEFMIAVGRRVGRSDEPFEAVVVGTAVARCLFEGVKPRAVASVEGSAHEVGDFVVRLGTLKQGGVGRAAILGIRYRPLRPSHAASGDAEASFLHHCLGLDADKDYTTHDPLALAPRHHITTPPREPSFDLDHLLNVVTCFRTTLYGRSAAGARPPAGPPTTSGPL